MKTVTALILTVILTACGAGDNAPEAVVVPMVQATVVPIDYVGR